MDFTDIFPFAVGDGYSAAAVGRSEDQWRTWAASMHWSLSGAIQTAESSAIEGLLQSFAADTTTQDSTSILGTFCFATPAASWHSLP